MKEFALESIGGQWRCTLQCMKICSACNFADGTEEKVSSRDPFTAQRQAMCLEMGNRTAFYYRRKEDLSRFILWRNKNEFVFFFLQLVLNN